MKSFFRNAAMFMAMAALTAGAVSCSDDNDTVTGSDDSQAAAFRVRIYAVKNCHRDAIFSACCRYYHGNFKTKYHKPFLVIKHPPFLVIKQAHFLVIKLAHLLTI